MRGAIRWRGGLGVSDSGLVVLLLVLVVLGILVLRVVRRMRGKAEREEWMVGENLAGWGVFVGKFYTWPRSHRVTVL